MKPHHPALATLPDFSALFDAVPAPTLVLTPTLVIVAANQAYRRLVGRASTEMLGQPLFSALDLFHSAQGEGSLRASLERVLASGLSDSAPAQRYYPALAGIDPLLHTVSNTALLDRHGRVTQLIHTVQVNEAPVTTPPAVLAALRESEAKFRTIAEALPQMVWSTLPDGYHDYYNDQWYVFTGMAVGSTDGDGWENVFHPDDQERARVAWQGSLATGKTYEIQYRLRHHSGLYRWVLGRALPIRADDGRILRWMGTCTDIHDQKLAEDELRQAARRKDEFLAMLAHELRNPLAPISSAAQLLMLGQADPAKVRKSGDIILRQVRHLTDLVDDLLDVSRVTRGLVQIEKTEIDLKAVLHSAIEQARPLIEARQHQLTVEMSEAPTLVLGDKTRLVQVVVNLLNNAAKYTAQGGQLTLSLEADEREACIMVADNGSGISPNLLPYVFDLFVQAERTPDRAQGGLGLGLALVKRIAALHDGSVHALSEGLGQGSSFMMILPLRSAVEEAGEEPASSGSQNGLAGPGRVLIVDDHVDGLQMLSALLTAQGHQVTMAQDGAGALREAAAGAFDVFILDIGLPDIDGYQLARQLRMTPAGSAALMVALTGYGQAHDRVLSKAAGFDHHFVKPVDSTVLAALLAQRSVPDSAAT